MQTVSLIKKTYGNKNIPTLLTKHSLTQNISLLAR